MKHHLTLLAILSSHIAFAQGPLTPPAASDPAIGPVNALTPGGAPQATMKTLHQVEPRTVIPGGTSTVTISQSGSYFLSADITVADGPGIVIAANGVMLDLNGFRIVSTNATPDFSDAGIGLAPSVKNITIRNGVICGDGIGGKFYLGIGPTGFSSSRNVTVADVSVSETTHWGITLDASTNSRVERSLVETEGASGAIQARLVQDCSVTGGAIFGRIVRNSSVQTGGAYGIFADVVENCHAEAAGTAISAKCLVNSYGTGNGSSDVISAGVVQNVWAQASGTGGGERAILATVAQNSVGTSGGRAIEAKALANAYAVGAGSVPVISADVVENARAEASGTGGWAIASAVVAHSFGTHAGTGMGINAEVVVGSYGRGELGTGIATPGAVTALSKAASFGASSYGLRCDDGLVIGSLAKAPGNALVAPDGSVLSSMGVSTGPYWGIAAPGGLVSQSFGGTNSQLADFGISAALLSGCYGTGRLHGSMADGCYSFLGVLAPLKFNSN